MSTCSSSAAASRWFSAFGVVIAIGLSAAAVAIAITVLLFRLIGPSRTRLVAQILAAIIGAGFVIALQIAAILSYGTLSRFAVLTSDAAAAFAPDPDSLVWWPARAALGDGEALLLLLAASLVLLGGVMAIFSPRFADTVVSASADCNARPVAGRAQRRSAAARGNRRCGWKEFMLLRRDPWLVSQSLMQLLYLVPPALMLWRSFSDSSAAIMLITPVIVMAAGQLAGGLAWLTISGEDAADLVATAPMPPSRVTRAKIEVVLIAIARRSSRRWWPRWPLPRRCRRRSPRSASSSRRYPPPRSSSGSACRPNAASSAAARPRRGWRRLRKPSARSAGPRPRRSR